MKPEKKSWFDVLMSQDRRRAERQAASQVVAYYWDGATPVAHAVRDISSAGLYLLTEHRWYPGTLVMITLQRTGGAETSGERSILVQSKVVRSGADGVGLAFVAPEARDAARDYNPTADAADKKTLDRFLQQIRMNHSTGSDGPGREPLRGFHAQQSREEKS